MKFKIGKFNSVLFLFLITVFCFTAVANADSSGLTSGKISLSTKMSSSIFLQPVPPDKKIVYVSARNTSTATGLDFRKELVTELTNEGYKITDNPDEANFMLMSNVLYIGKETKDYTAEGALAGGFGGALIGSAFNPSGKYTGTIAGGVIGALAGAAIGNSINSDKYMMVVDVQLEERQPGTQTETTTNATQGTATTETSSNSTVKDWAIYRDRVVSEASGTNIKFEDVEPVLRQQLAHAIANLLP
ncbi:TraT complement resistance family protein [Thermodesulfobium narugense DSM 14796]|uniref:TraT complement resistance family protein n=1 Tax=Thermodesulfobium narugense DSM 14796 TaxID=747365 RepID=M1E7P9_9BACT|nr:complement resistance protein TraT [Thermodesulfobium narugense]AEE15346.1 TraT complement resistance family protein [Thermodesulfobium narugense DSM 14796]